MPKNKPKTIRVWVDHKNSWVRVTLIEDQEFYFCAAGSTDEGWYRRETSLSYNDGYVWITTCDTARDCDGRHERVWQCNWQPSDGTRPAFVDWDRDGNDILDESIQIPNWQSVSSRNRDQFAEQMGY